MQSLFIISRFCNSVKLGRRPPTRPSSTKCNRAPRRCSDSVSYSHERQKFIGPAGVLRFPRKQRESPRQSVTHGVYGGEFAKASLPQEWVSYSTGREALLDHPGKSSMPARFRSFCNLAAREPAWLSGERFRIGKSIATIQGVPRVVIQKRSWKSRPATVNFLELVHFLLLRPTCNPSPTEDTSIDLILEKFIEVPRRE